MQEAPTPQYKIEPGDGKRTAGAVGLGFLSPALGCVLCGPDSPLPNVLKPVVAAILFAIPAYLFVEGSIEARRATRRKSSYRNNC